MEKKFKLGVIGAGFMATAIVKGVISSKIILPENIIMSDLNTVALDKVMELGVNTTVDNSYLANNSEYVLFAVKPQSLSDVFISLNNAKFNKVISIMAGIKKNKISSKFKDVSVARCMPNTPCSIGCGAIGVDLTDYTNENDKNFIKSILSCLGEVVEVPESKLNAVTGISGSSPAYFYLFLKGIIDAGVKAGLTEDESKKLATATMVGSGKMVQKNTEKTLDELIKAVCSKGGTTIEAINVYQSKNLGEITEKAVDACIKRSFELENL
ncbi:MAG: pyrroline-5-carboxylate reductase [Clostridia bacterium]|nr:pyrroline-5-carboxylate reductase [Clostridia bacterium]